MREFVMKSNGMIKSGWFFYHNNRNEKKNTVSIHSIVGAWNIEPENHGSCAIS